jgi:hypothetical protein
MQFSFKVFKPPAFSGALVGLRKATLSFCMSVCFSACPSVLPHGTTRLPLEGFLFNPLNAELNPICHLLALSGAHLILHVSRIRVNLMFMYFFFENFSRKFKFRYILTRMASSLHDDLCTFTIMSRWILLRARTVSDRTVEQIKTYIFFLKPCRLWDNMEKYGRDRQVIDDSIIRRMRFSCWLI